MSYHLGQSPRPPTSLTAASALGSMTGVGTTVVVVGVLGLIGVLVYWRIRMTQEVLKSHGVGGALAFEGGMAAIDLLSRNKRRRRRRKRRTSRRNSR